MLRFRAPRVSWRLFQNDAEGGREMGLTAAAFEQRSIDESWAWLDEIEALRLAGKLDADAVLKLVHARR